MMICVQGSDLVIVQTSGFQANNLLMILVGVFKSPIGNRLNHFNVLMTVNSMVLYKQ